MLKMQVLWFPVELGANGGRRLASDWAGIPLGKQEPVWSLSSGSVVSQERSLALPTVKQDMAALGSPSPLLCPPQRCLLIQPSR